MSDQADYFSKFADSDIALIPVNGKISLVKKWQRFSDEMPEEEEIETWDNLKNITGIGLVMGEASNICCIDVDEEDPTLLRKILDACPISPLVKRGKKGETRFFRLAEKHGDYRGNPFNDKKIAIDREFLTMSGKKIKKRSVDILLSHCYSVIPPSIHPDTKEEYVWTSGQFAADYDIEELPVLDIFKEVTKLSALVKGEKVEDLMPDTVKPSGRWTKMNEILAACINKKMSGDATVAELIKYDDKHHGHDPFLFDRSKGSTFSSKCKITNAYKFYADRLHELNRQKNNVVELETPELGAAVILPEMEEGWLEPSPLRTNAIETEFDNKLIPGPWYEWITESSEAASKSPHLMFYIAMAGLSSMLGNKISVRPKPNDTFTVTPNLFVMLIAPSGSRKTEVLSKALSGMKSVSKEVEEGHKEIHKKWLRDVRETKILKKKAEMKLSKAIEDGEPTLYLDELKLEIEKLEKLEKEPKCKQLKINVATPEAIIDILDQNKTGTLIVENELAGLLARFRKQGYETLKTLMMDSWDGDKEFTYNTKSGGRTYIEKLCTSMITCTQPSVIEDLIRGILQKKQFDDGFLQRSLFVADTPNDMPIVDKAVGQKVLDRVSEMFRFAYFLPDINPEIPLSPKAHLRYMQFLQEIQTKINNEKFDSIASFIGKQSSNSIKVAFLIEFIKLDGKSLPTEVSLESFLAAIQILKYNEDFMRKSYANSINVDDLETLEEIVSMFKSGTIDNGIKVKEFYKTNTKLLKSNTNTLKLLQQLEVLNYCKVASSNSSFVVLINPCLL